MISNHKFFHWLYFHKKKHSYFNFGTGLFIWLFLALTLPFGMYDNNVSSKLFLMIILLPYGLVWPLISYSMDYFVKYLLHLKAHENHQIDFKILFLKLFLLVHISFLIRNILSNWSDIYWSEYLQLWMGCILLLSLTYIPFSLYARSRYLQKMLGKDNNEQEELFEFFGDGKDTLKANLNEIVHIKSDDNYVEITTFNQDGILKTLLFRATLKSITEQLKSQSQFIRVHRSFIVNLQFTVNFDNKDSLKVKIGDEEMEIPVSKKYKEEILKLLE